MNNRKRYSLVGLTLIALFVLTDNASLSAGVAQCHASGQDTAAPSLLCDIAGKSIRWSDWLLNQHSSHGHFLKLLELVHRLTT